jgi:hypothetical protein
MSDTAMDTPDASQIVITKAKGYKPDLYYGERRKLQTWLLQVDRHFHMEGDRIENADKVVLASSYMRGDAEKWVEPILLRYMDDTITDGANTNLVEDWTLFKGRLREIFSPIKESAIAEQKIQSLRQTTSVADYTTVFQQYMEQIEWDDNALIRMYKQGLKLQVREELMRTGTQIGNLQQLMNEAIRLDNDLYELRLESRGYKEPNYDTGRRQNNGNNGRGKPRHQPNQGRQRNQYVPRHNYPPRQGYYAPGGTVAMEIDTLHKKPTPPTPKQGHSMNRKEITCYACGKKGHMSRDCRSKNKVTRQLNVLAKVPEDSDEEWTVVNPQGQVFTDAVPNSNEWDTLQEYITEGLEKGIIMRSSLVTTERQGPRGHIRFKPQYEPKADEDTEYPQPTEPHPGDRISGSWDQESVTSRTDPEEVLSLEELSIHTPPASPKLRRENATMGKGKQKKDDQPWYHHSHKRSSCRKQKKVTYANDGQAQVLNEEPSWVDTAEEAYRQRNIEYYEPTMDDKYLVDIRNPLHGTLHWTACTTAACQKHYDDKLEGYFPVQAYGRRCKYLPEGCTQIACPEHLFDKRITMGYFPGLDDTEKARCNILVNGYCINRDWRTCQHERCGLHLTAKQENGYAIPFLGGRRTQELAATLSRRRKDLSNS